MVTPRALPFMILALGVMCADSAMAQSYPSRPIRIVTGGGANDFQARLVAAGLTGPLGQSIIVENRPSTVIAEIVAKATPDGYTMLVGGPAVWYAPLTQKTQYDPLKDLAPISIIGTTPYVLFVTNALPVKSVKDLIAYAKAHPGELNNSVGAAGGTSHLAGELFKLMGGIKTVAVHYSNGSQELVDLTGGRIHFTLTTPVSLMEQAKAGKLKALAVASLKSSTLAPDLPTIATSGLPGYEWEQTNALFAPAKTPVSIINRLNHEVVQLLNTKGTKERLLSIGIEARPSTPKELTEMMQSEMSKLRKLLEETGIKPE